jgi:hypothetical protein
MWRLFRKKVAEESPEKLEEYRTAIRERADGKSSGLIYARTTPHLAVIVEEIIARANETVYVTFPDINPDVFATERVLPRIEDFFARSYPNGVLHFLVCKQPSLPPGARLATLLAHPRVYFSAIPAERFPAQSSMTDGKAWLWEEHPGEFAAGFNDPEVGKKVIQRFYGYAGLQIAA